jgi:hypothetical protein
MKSAPSADKGAADGHKTDGAATPAKPPKQGIGSEIVALGHAYSVIEDVAYGVSYFRSLDASERTLSALAEVYRQAPSESAQEAAALVAIGELGPTGFDYLAKEYRGATVQSRREAIALAAMGFTGEASFDYLAREYRGATSDSLREAAALVGLGAIGNRSLGYLQQEYRGATTNGDRETSALVGLGLVGEPAFSYLTNEYRGSTTGSVREVATVVGLCLTRAAGSRDYARRVYNGTQDRRLRAAVDFGLDQAMRF